MPARSSPPLPASPDTGLAQRRFRASDVPAHLDMEVIGEVCLGVTLAGYQSVLCGFLDDPAGSLAGLLRTLDQGGGQALHAQAHAVRGGAASLGLRALQALAAELEAPSAEAPPLDGPATAAALRTLTDTTRALLQRMGLLPA